MAISNAVYMDVKPSVPLDGAGWTVKVLSYKDYATPVAIINQYKRLMVSVELNNVGAGSIDLSLEDSFWDTYMWNGVTARDIVDKERQYLFQAWEDGVLRFEFFGMRIKDNSVNSSEEKTVTISGPGIAECLKWASVLPPNFPRHKKTVHWNSKNPAMKFYSLLVKGAQKRGTIPYVNMNFSHHHDSSGKRWSDLNNIREFKVEYAENLLDVLNMATGQDSSDPWNIRADWLMSPRFRLDVRQNFGARRDKYVIFYEGAIDEKTHRREREKIANYVALHDGLGNYHVVTNSASRINYQQREYVEKNSTIIGNPKRANEIAQILLQQRMLEESEWILKVPYDLPTRRPFRDYGVGDWVGVSKFVRNQPSKVEPHRVLGITIMVDEDETQVELTLESLYQKRQRDLERKLTKILHTPLTSEIKVPNKYKVPEDVPMPVIWSPKDGYRADPNYKIAGEGTGSGPRVFAQSTDPAGTPSNNVKTGDWWLETYGGS